MPRSHPRPIDLNLCRVDQGSVVFKAPQVTPMGAAGVYGRVTLTDRAFTLVVLAPPSLDTTD